MPGPRSSIWRVQMRNVLLGFLLCAQTTSGPDAVRPQSPAEEYRALLEEWETYVARATRESAAATTDEAQKRFSEENLRVTHGLGKRALQLARAHPEDPAALDALLWVVGKGYRPETGEAYELLLRDHIDSPRLAPACRATRRAVIAEPALTERFLRAVLAKNPSREVKGQACFSLAAFLNFRAEAMRDWKDHPDVRAKMERGLKTPENLAMYRDRSPEDLEREAEGLFERVVAEFADLKDARGRTLGALAKGDLNKLRHLRVGQVAPEIEGEGADGQRFMLSDFRGKVVVLTFSGNWCGPCRAHYPEERKLVERLKGKRFALLSVNTDDDRETLRKSIASGEVTWRCWWDGAPGGLICTHWGIETFPTIYVLDQRGVIRHKEIGGKELEEAVESLLK